jgi:small GTP-binding protein
MTLPPRKICLLGDFAVGKTSTVARAVRNTFSGAYLTTVGVKVDSKTVALADDRALRLVLWDIAGTNVFDQIRETYLKGTHGLLLVADGTRIDTITTALSLWAQVEQRHGGAMPAVLMLNKADLGSEWEIPLDQVETLRARLPVFSTSAKAGSGIEEAFAELARRVAP